MATIKDVARLAGTSIATVSRHLNGERVRGGNARRIDEAVELLGYHPSLHPGQADARHLGMVGMVMTALNNPFVSTVAEHAQNRLYEKGYGMVAMGCQHDPKKIEGVLHYLLQRGVSGIIMACCIFPQAAQSITSLRALHMPAVAVDQLIPDADCVFGDGEAGAYEAVSHLIHHGHRRIGFIGAKLDNEGARNRHDGYVRAMVQHAVPIHPLLIRLGDYSAGHGRKAVSALMALEQPPTAILAASHDISVGAMEALVQRDIRIPQDISFIMYDEILPVDILPQGITTVCQPVEEMGRAAADLLIQRMEGSGETAGPICTRLPPTLHKRNSVRPLQAP